MKKRGIVAIVRDIREHIDRAVPYNCTFIDAIPSAHKAAAQEQLRQNFVRWHKSWIDPLLDEIEAKFKKL